MSSHRVRTTDETGPDFETCLFVFMLAFWPVAIVFGLIDFIFIPAYDLRLLDILVGAIAGFIAVKRYQAKLEERGQAS